MTRRTALLLTPLLFLPACEPAAQEAEAVTTAEEAQQPAAPERGTVEWKIQNATSAGPANITRNATVMDWAAEPGGELMELRAGTNGWTCMPDVPTSPGEDPMCLDATFLQWAGAWQGHTTPTITTTGLAYMLAGGTDASNTDPYATEPTQGDDWVRTGPHIMIVVPDVALLESISTDPGNGGPFVMWKGTPYAHVMMPVEH